MAVQAHLSGPCKVVCRDEEGSSHEKASVRIYDGGERLALHVHAIIEYKKGADGGLYPCVVFKKVE